MSGGQGPIPVVLLLSPGGRTPAEAWMARARLAASRDLLARLLEVPAAGQVFVLAGNPDDQKDLVERGATPLPGDSGPFHFGRTLASIVQSLSVPRVAYFGGASAPLATVDTLRGIFERAMGGDRVLVNNYHSTDWAIVSPAEKLIDVAERLVSDNALGWVLAHEAGLPVEAMPASAASRADLDTPSDVAMTASHPGLGLEMRRVSQDLPQAVVDRMAHLRELLTTPGRNLTLMGRVSSGVWRSVEERTQIWVRVFSEERGLLASGRAARGEVKSLVGGLLDEIGPRAFLQRLASMTDGVLWDTRVWMSTHGAWPSPADRFASDLGHTDEIEDLALRELTAAVAEAAIPVITGGHGVVAGGLLAVLETIDTSGPWPLAGGQTVLR
ncbi:MAG TPA: hypothetical protein VFI11_15505 [Anaerolineales bacterium]|nr:hypothetical protein [Anaerolineales bacterium]